MTLLLKKVYPRERWPLRESARVDMMTERGSPWYTPTWRGTDLVFHLFEVMVALRPVYISVVEAKKHWGVW